VLVIVSVLCVGFFLGWAVNRADFDEILDVLAVLRECILNLRQHKAMPAAETSDIGLTQSVASGSAQLDASPRIPALL
jgi:hypothetical protein